MKFLDIGYSFIKPQATANIFQIYMNKIIERMVCITYMAYSHIHKINNNKEEIDLIISLTSFPQRINKIYYCIYSLLNQSIKPRKVVLWLATSQFPRYDLDLPQELLELKKYGLEIRYCQDFRSYKKFVPSAYLDYKSIIVTADDDVLYPESWLYDLYVTHKKFPTEVVCHRAHRITFNKNNKVDVYSSWEALSPSLLGPSKELVAIGVGGVLYPPLFFEKLNFCYDDIRKISPTSDDLFLKFLEISKKVKVVKVNRLSKEFISIIGSQKERLSKANVEEGSANDLAVKELIKYFSVSSNMLMDQYSDR